MRVVRQASAGLIWSKQIYPYDVSRWLEGDPASPPPPAGRRSGTERRLGHLDSFDVLAMPDPWEYPWFAAWDLAFHAIPWAHLDPAFAKYQLTVLLREWFLHPNGALPAYEWNFDDVNPPVHALAAIRVFVIDGSTDTDFLERIFQKLLLNFTWWVNRQDPDGNNLFGGGFLGLDNISPVDRSNLPPDLRIEQADGTAWMAYYSLAMLVLARTLAERNDVYDDMVVKFLEHFVLISDALESSGLFHPEDGFFYDRLIDPHGNATPIQVQSLVGVLPGLPAASVSLAESESVQSLRKRFAPPPREGPARGRPSVAVHGRGNRAAPARLDGHSGPARWSGRDAVRRGGVPLAVRPAVAVQAARGDVLRARRRGWDRLPARRVPDRDVRRELQLAWTGLVADQLPRHPCLAAVRPVLRRRLPGRVPHRLGHEDVLG